MRSWDWWGKVSRRGVPRLPAAATSTLLLPLKALAQWPERTIFMVVGYAAGGGPEIIRGGIPKPMERLLRRSINVTNREGSVAALATDFIWKRPVDGHWWLGTSNYNKFLRVQGLHQTTPWKDWQFYKIASTIAAWAVKPDSPYRTFADVIEAARRRPGQGKGSNSGSGGLMDAGPAGGELCVAAEGFCAVWRFVDPGTAARCRRGDPHDHRPAPAAGRERP